MTRHELKEQVQHDAFAESVAKVVDYTTTHRSLVIKWAVIAVVAALIVAGVLWYNSSARAQRQADLEAAFQVLSAPVGQTIPGMKTYPTEDAKRTASLTALNDVIKKDGGSREGRIAQYYRGTLNVQQDPKLAESDLKAVSDRWRRNEFPREGRFGSALLGQ